ncbi:MAG TPA: cupin domain-containing protein, partial [Candidatus Angelobacter sp.]|nr:cupin domain-containing protein [Candidatus Angelobacter sp.]
MDHLFFPDLAAEATPVGRGIHSQTISKGDGVEVVLFSLAAGEELSEHTSARPVIVHVLRGSGRLSVAEDRWEVAPGAWLRMPARTPHS